MQAVSDLGYSERCSFAIRLALEEGLINAIQHGNKGDQGKSVDVVYDADEKRIEITITDQGEGFDPETIPDPTVDENLEKPTGRGIMLMRAYMDEVHFSQHGKRVILTKFNEPCRRNVSCQNRVPSR